MLYNSKGYGCLSTSRRPSPPICSRLWLILVSTAVKEILYIFLSEAHKLKVVSTCVNIE